MWLRACRTKAANGEDSGRKKEGGIGWGRSWSVYPSTAYCLRDLSRLLPPPKVFILTIETQGGEAVLQAYDLRNSLVILGWFFLDGLRSATTS